MIKLENIKVYNIDQAIEGMRYAMKSTDKADSFFCDTTDQDVCKRCAMAHLEDSYDYPYYRCTYLNKLKRDRTQIPFYIGENDMKLAQKLIRSGSPHDKFMRQIFVSMDISAPLYWWKEFDTYKVATTANSESTMHTIHKEGITKELYSLDNNYKLSEYDQEVEDRYFKMLESWRIKAANGDKDAWRCLIQHNPDGFIQKRKWTGNYANLRGMWLTGRKNHKLNEWNFSTEGFTSLFEKLPYGKELICLEK